MISHRHPTYHHHHPYHQDHRIRWVWILWSMAVLTDVGQATFLARCLRGQPLPPSTQSQTDRHFPHYHRPTFGLVGSTTSRLVLYYEPQRERYVFNQTTNNSIRPREQREENVKEEGGDVVTTPEIATLGDIMSGRHSSSPTIPSGDLLVTEASTWISSQSMLTRQTTNMMTTTTTTTTTSSPPTVSPLYTPRSTGPTISTAKSLAEAYGITHPLDRMALTANGNLQRLVSSYYDSPVSVNVEQCVRLRNATRPMTMLQPNPSPHPNRKVPSSTTPIQYWNRVVHLKVHGQIFCTATSEIQIMDPLCQQLVGSGRVGLGQLFRYLDLLPHFELHAAAPYPEGGFWRDYSLSCHALSCRIHERFVPDMWNLTPPM